MRISYRNSVRTAGRSIRILCCALALLTASCRRLSNNLAANSSPDPFSAATPHDRYPDDLGRFLAGLPGRAGSPFSELEKQPAWIDHRQELDRAWSAMAGSSLSAMQIFQRQELVAASTPQAPILYPFSGPDALMVTIFFPTSPVYVMAGLEPAGTLPSPRQL